MVRSERSGRVSTRLNGRGAGTASASDQAACEVGPGAPFPRRGTAGRLLGLVVALAVAACVSTSPAEDRDAAVYSQVVSWFLAGAAPEAPVFLDHLDEIGIDLAVQAEVVARLEDFDSVRFIDDVDEAIEASVEGAPVRDDGVFVRLGTPVGDGTVTVTASRYLSEGESETYEFVFRLRRTRWEVQGEPVPITLDP